MAPDCARFGDFELDLRKYELRRAGRPVKLERIPMELLILLVRSHGELVARELIVERLWGKDVFLETERGINTAINKLRMVLRDDPRQPQFLQTVIGKGYRFIAEVQMDREGPVAENTGPALIRAALSPPRLVTSEAPVLEIPTGDPIPEQDPGRVQRQNPMPLASVTTFPGSAKRIEANGQSAESSAKRRGVYFVALGIAAIAVSVLGFLYMRRTAQKASRGFQSVAVLPLLNLSQNSEQEYLVDGLTDEVITDLARATSLGVISHTSVMPYKGARKPINEIARALNVDAIVEGSVLRAGQEVRITVQLLDARHDRHLWAESYRPTEGDPLTIQAEVASQIAHEVAAHLGSELPDRSVRVVAPQARDLYLRGRYFWNKRTRDALEKSIAYYEQAVQADPHYAEAYAALGDSYVILSYYGGPGPAETFPRARAAAEKALQLDDSLAEAHTVLAKEKEMYEYDWPGAEAEYLRALELGPGYATAHHWYSLHLETLRQYDKAQHEIELARQLDPLSLVINVQVADLACAMRNPQKAKEAVHRVLDLDPNYALGHDFLARADEEQVRYPEAIQEFQRAYDLSGGDRRELALKAHALALSGKPSDARRIVKGLEDDLPKHYVETTYIAAVYCALGHQDTAMRWLEKAYAAHEDGIMELTEPLFDGCRSYPRFQNLLKEARLPN